MAAALPFITDIGGVAFIHFDRPDRANDWDYDDSSSDSSDSSESSESVVTSANDLTGDVEWVGGNKIKVKVIEGNRIKISFDSDAEDPYPESDDSSDCKHPEDTPGTGEDGGVNPDEDDDHGVSGGGTGGGGVPADGDTHAGDDDCCGTKR